MTIMFLVSITFCTTFLNFKRHNQTDAKYQRPPSVPVRKAELQLGGYGERSSHCFFKQFKTFIEPTTFLTQLQAAFCTKVELHFFLRHCQFLFIVHKDRDADVVPGSWVHMFSFQLIWESQLLDSVLVHELLL